MTPRVSLRAAVALAMAFLLVSLSTVSCKKKSRTIDPAFAQFISAFTSGTVSAAGTIRIRLTDQFVDNVTVGQPIADELLTFSPRLEGELVWIDPQTLEFRPKEWMERGETYEATFELGRIVTVPDNLSEFVFDFTVMTQNIHVEVQSVSSYRTDDLSRMQMTGLVRTMDVCDHGALEQVLRASQDGRSLPLQWSHTDDHHLHSFSVDSIYRGESASKVILQWDGEAVGAEQEGSHEQEIPALGDFRMFFWNVVQQPEQFVVLQFSDPLDPNQNVDGLIDIPGVEGERFTIERNEVRLYPPYRLSGTMQLLIHPGVKNIMGYASQEEQSITIEFEELRPSVEIPDPERVILPSTNGQAFAFRAVNLSAVDVRIIQVFENNVPQFLQVNDLGGESEMRRVGRQVAKARVELNPEGNKDLAQWNTFYLDLDRYIRPQPGAIYRVEIGFRRAYSLYHCEDHGEEAEEDMEEIPTDDDPSQEEFSYWDYYEDYGYGDYYDEYYDWNYDWDERDNPCSAAYYQHHRPVGKNILASDIGLLAKKGTDGSFRIFVNDIRTANAMADADIEILNYQQQVLHRMRSDSRGEARVAKLEGVPFLVVVRKGDQRGYLKIDGDHSLSVSTFDVGGSTTQKGLKGFIYGERGVWRPGDSLYLSFILEDEVKSLPKIHPVHFELVNPRGQVVQKMVRSKGENGFYRFTCSTTADAETGIYLANVRVGGATFSKSLRVETIKPNRLKLALDFGKEQLTATDAAPSGVLEAKWLHGATARNLKALVSATFTSGNTHFERFSEYTFDDPVRQFDAEEQVIFEGHLNAEGKASIQLRADLEDMAPGMVNAHVNVKVFEEGGDFSTDRFTVPFAPYETFVGIRLPKGDKERGMLLTDTDHQVDVVTVDAAGKPVGGKQLNWKVYKVSWRWWWEQSSDDLSNYVGGESSTPIAEGSCATGADGKGAFRFRVDYPEWGRYLVRIEDEEGGHATGKPVYIDWPGWAGRAQRENPGGASMLSFTTDKERYTTGENCTVTFPSSGVGRALISIENGTRVINSWWVDAEKEQTSFHFPTTPEMTPNAYIHITLLQPHSQTENDHPIRLYGIMPLFVENPGSHLEPVITMKDELSPEKSFDVKVCEKNGKEMTYTLAVVDEGLLDLTRFRTPDPWNHFYAREALGVSTYDIYDEVIGAYGAKLEKLLSIGGSDEGGGKGKNRANRFKPVVMYLGPFTLPAGQCRTHTLSMPNYIGSVKVMVVAGKDQAYGNAEKVVPVKKPLMVLASLPRVLGPDEEVRLPVTVFAMDKNIRDVQVKVEASDILGMKDGSTRSISFSEPGDQVVNFSLKAAAREGIAKVKVTVTSGAHKSTYEVEMEVRTPNPVMTRSIDAVVESGQQWQTTFDLPGIQGTNTAVLEVSSIPSVNFGRRLKYLLDYPHGCVEQTTSSAFPQLYLADVMDLSEAERKRASDNVKSAINKLARYQSRTGGIVYWPGDPREDEWCSNYVGHFMLEAKAKGFTLPGSFEQNWIGYQKRMVQAWRPIDAQSGNPYFRSNDLVQAYRLYTLALAGQADIGAMNRLRERSSLTSEARWRLAAAYALAGQSSTAQQLAAQASTSVATYQELSFSFGSAERDKAMIIEALTLMGDRARAAQLVKELATALSSDQWYSTQATAFSLMAISKFAAGETGRQINYRYTLNGKGSATFASQKPVHQGTLDARMSGNSIQFNNTSGNILYVRVILSGKPANGAETASRNELSMEVRYLTMKGEPMDVTRIEQGTDFVCEVKVSQSGVRGRLDELALTQVFPSGWEILNSRLETSAAVINADQPDYVDYRDDRVYTYFDLLPQKTKTFRVKLNATYLGRYYLPAVNCEAMYDHTIHARTTGQWVEVYAPSASTAQR